MNKQTKIVFFGTPEFARPSLKALYQEGFNIVLVVTQPDKAVGRKQQLTPSAIKIEAKKLGLNVCDEIKELRLKLEDLKPIIGIVVAYGKIISKEILDLFSLGCLNIHPSLLPKYRGSSPIQSAILNGDLETGVSIIKLDEKMDHGPIISNFKFQISKSDTAESLHSILSQKGAELLIKTLPDYLSGKINSVPQDDSLATFSKILKREDGEINWQKSAVEIERQVRAYYPWPGSFTKIKDLRSKTIIIKILSAQVSINQLEKEIGQFYDNNGQLTINCGQGSLVINKLQPEGKKEITAKEFINGYL